MAGFRSTLELEATTYGRRLVDRASGAVLPLSDLEAKLVQQWNGSASAVELSAQLLGRGVEVEASQVAAFFRRLDRIGLLAVPPPGDAGLVPPSPGLDAPGDTVPRFRTDLLVDPAPEARGVLQVTDPTSQRTFTLYDFELSMARMLDGRRKARDLLAAADVIGVTVTLSSLQAFLQQLKAFRFLELAPSAVSTTWRPRRPWSEEVRELYQQALRLARRGQEHEALSCLESVLEVDPENEEAPGLMARLTAVRAGQQALGVAFEVLHGEPAARLTAPAMKPEYVLAQGDPFDAFEPVTDPALRAAGRASKGPALWPAGVPGPEAVHRAVSLKEAEETAPAAEPPREALDTSDGLEPVARRRRLSPGLVAAVAAAVVVLGVLLFPVPVTQVVACTLAVSEVGAVKLPAEGAVTLQVAAGAPVKAGDAVGVVKPRVDRKAVEAQQERVKVLEGKLRALPEPPAARAQVARRAVATAQAAVDPLLKQRARLEPQKGAAARKKLAALDKALRPKLVAVEKARAALEALTHAEARGQLEGQLAAARKALEGATAVAAPVPVLAPASGLLLPSAEPAEGPVGAVVAQVVAPGLLVRLGEAEGAQGQVLVSVAGGAPQPAREAPGGRWLDGAPALAGKPCTATVPAGRKPLLLTLL